MRRGHGAGAGRRARRLARRAGLRRPGGRSPRSPIWTPAISPPTSRPAPNTATACSGWCCSPTSSPCCSRRCPPSSASSPARNLAEMCRDQFPRPVVLAMWVVSEIAAMATDLAEFLGGAIGLSLLFHMPLLAGMAVTAIVTYGILMFEGFGFRPIELIIGAIVGVIGLCYLVEMFIAPVDWASAALPSGRAADRRCRGAAARGRHHRRHRHAARDLSAFRPDAGAHAGAQRRRAAQGAALLQPRGGRSRSPSPASSTSRW